MSTHNIFFYGEIRKILSLLFGAMYNKENLFGTGKNWS